NAVTGLNPFTSSNLVLSVEFPALKGASMTPGFSHRASGWLILASTVLWPGMSGCRKSDAPPPKAVAAAETQGGGISYVLDVAGETVGRMVISPAGLEACT